MSSIDCKEDAQEKNEECTAAIEDRCCFWWQITRGPHITTVYHYCVQQPPVESSLSVGRHKKCWIRLKKDLEVSGKHAEFEFFDDSSCFTLKDLKSTNGTRLNGEVLEPHRSYLLHPQDLILIGKTTLRFFKGAKTCLMKKDKSCPKEQRSDSINAAEGDPVHEFVSNKENLMKQLTQKGDDDSIVKSTLPKDVTHQNPPSEECDDFHPMEMIGKLLRPKVNTHKADVYCLVCHKDLSHMDILHRQMHLNTCLDDVKPTSSSMMTGATKKAKKRKKANNNAEEKEQLNLALALSKSLVEPHEQIAMEMQCVSSQIAQVDAEMAKLLKQKAKLQAKYKKLQKKYIRIKPTQVLGPDRIQMEVDKMLDFLFPPHPEKEFVAQLSHTRTRQLKKRLIRWKNGNSCEKISMFSGQMWTLASQMETNPSMYLTQLFFKYSTFNQDDHVDTADVQKTDADKEAINTITSVATLGSSSVAIRPADSFAQLSQPVAIEKIFPNWSENVSFLLEQSHEDLENAWREMKLKHEQILEQQDTSLASIEDQVQVFEYVETFIQDLLQKSKAMI